MQKEISSFLPISSMSDVTIVGSCKKADGIGQNAIGFVSCLHKDVDMNVIHTRTLCGDGLSPEILSVFKKPVTKKGKVAILTSSIFWYDLTNIYHDLPEESSIKIAYSMMETTELAKEGVDLLNQVFDAVVVPDPWVAEVYSASGVAIPIFVLPLALDLEDFLSERVLRSALGKDASPFVFLNTCAFMERKNHILLIDAFREAFQDRNDVQLVLHGRRGSSNDAWIAIEQHLEKLQASNIRMQRETLSREKYIALMQKAHCFVSLSKGEGFAVPPREALAMGIPCILTSNSAHTTLCKTGFVTSVPSNVLEPAFCPLLFRYSGEEYNCLKEDAVVALLDMVERYSLHLEKAKEGGEWVKQYLPNSLRSQYLSLVKPSQVLLGDHNEIHPDYLMTSSKKLYDKYQAL